MSIGRRIASCVLLVLSVGVAAGCRDAETPAAPAGGPVIVISIDTLRADHLPAYGATAVSTPAIDALARDSIVFENAYSQVPLTLPSHVSMLTGKLPAATGVRNNLGYRFDPATPSLPSLLRAAGYSTAAMVSAYVLRAETGLGGAFEHYDDRVDTATTGAILGEIQRGGDATVSAALDWLRRSRDGRFFLFVHLFEPHAPYDPPEPWRSKYAASPYDGEIAAADAAVGRLIETLRATGRYDDATIVFMSDHGEGLGDHGESEHGIFLYREAIRVPLFLKLPGGRMAGRRVDAPAALVDVFPTIAEIAGLRIEGGTEGVSLLRLAEGARPDRRIFSETMYPRIHLGWSDLASLVDGSHHFIDAPRPELYDLRADPRETTNAIAGARRVFAAMKREMDGFDRTLSAPSAISPEEAAKLSALGYLGGTSASSGPLPDPKDRIADLESFGEATALYKSGRSAEAIPILRAVVEKNPAFADAWTLLAKAYDESGRLEDALSAYERTAQVAPSLAAGTMLSLSEVLLKLGRFDEAIAHADLSRSAHPAQARLMRAKALMGKRDPEGAARELDAVIADEATRAEGRVLLAQVRAAQRRLDEASSILDAVESEAAGAVPNLSFARGDVLMRQGRVAEAKEAMRREVADFPRNREAWIRLGAILVLEGKVAEAEGVMNEMVRRNSDPSVYAMIAEAYRGLGRADLAKRWEAAGAARR